MRRKNPNIKTSITKSIIVLLAQPNQLYPFVDKKHGKKSCKCVKKSSRINLEKTLAILPARMS
jgi:hypothetical protein